MASIPALDSLPLAPDVLRRFVSNDHASKIGNNIVTSNDPELVKELIAELSRQNGIASLTWRVVLDKDLSPHYGEPTRMVLENTEFLMFGIGAVFGIDWDTREVFGFIAADDATECKRAMILSNLVDAVAETLGDM